jgi:hypothetical protein
MDSVVALNVHPNIPGELKTGIIGRKTIGVKRNWKINIIPVTIRTLKTR